MEITETSVIADFARSQQVIQDLWDRGIVVSIDDFGAGFTSLAHLSSLAVKELKLDRTFISGLGAVTADASSIWCTQPSTSVMHLVCASSPKGSRTSPPSSC